jgi:triple functional domain protein
MTWVIADHVAAAGSQELSVHKGQQVEVLELNTATPDWCLVRMPTSGSSVDSPPEGLVPLAVLKQPPPGLKTSPSRRAASDHDSGEYSVIFSLPIVSYFQGTPGGTELHVEF